MKTKQADQILIIVRGLPGAGKSTKATQLATELGYTHVESDMFFMKDGTYQFDPSRLCQAHNWCRERVADLLESGKSVVVSNTFTRKWEMLPYIPMATDNGIDLLVLKVVGNFKTIHNVPDSVIEKMRNRWQDYPGEITIHNISFD